MPDLFTHMLVGYVIAVALSWRYEWIAYPYVTLTMGGRSSRTSTGSNWRFRRRRLRQYSGFRGHGCRCIALVEPSLSSVSGRYLHQRGSAVECSPYSRSAPHLTTRSISCCTSPPDSADRSSGHSPITDSRSRGSALSSDRWPALVMITIAAAVWYLDRRRARANGEASVDGSTTDNTAE